MGKGIVSIALGIAIFLGLVSVNNTLAGLWIGVPFIILGFIFIKFSSNKDNEARKENWLNQFPAAKFKSFNDNTGIAIDDKKIHLYEEGYTKSYLLSDVRSWATKFNSGGEIFSTGGGITNVLAAGANNRDVRKQNALNTGLFVSVRDVDKPEWRVTFSKNESDEKIQQARWNEILTQSINER